MFDWQDLPSLVAVVGAGVIGLELGQALHRLGVRVRLYGRGVRGGRQEALPPRLSEFDREQFFTLMSADVAAIREQFRSDHRLPAALMLMFMRVASRSLDGFNMLPVGGARRA